jgi:hypothetical protein
MRKIIKGLLVAVTMTSSFQAISVEPNYQGYEVIVPGNITTAMEDDKGATANVLKRIFKSACLCKSLITNQTLVPVLDYSNDFSCKSHDLI